METVAVGVAAVALILLGLLIGRRSGASVAPQRTVPQGSKPAPSPEVDDSLRLERGLASLPLGVVVVDAAGEDIFRNEVAEGFRTARHGEALVEAAISEVVERAITGQSAHKQVDLWGPPPRSFDLHGTPTLERGECVGATITVEDTSAEHQALRLRRDLVANVSHELRTPVGAMVALSETLEHAEDADVKARMIGRVKAQAIRLSEIVDDLLVLSQAETSEVSGFEPIDVGELVGSVLELSSPIADERGVSLIALNHAKSAVMVEGNRRQLFSLVTNLCDNAIKYSPDGSRVVLSVDQDSSSALITVKDTGVGIPESEIGRIFERFYRVDNARSRDTGGSGLGLAIVRNVTKIHGGSITVRSVEGRGSTFVAQLPLLLENPDTKQPVIHERDLS